MTTPNNTLLYAALAVGAYVLLSQRRVNVAASAGVNGANQQFFTSPASAQKYAQSQNQANISNGLFNLLGQGLNKILSSNPTVAATPLGNYVDQSQVGPTSEDYYAANPPTLYQQDLNANYL
jgi:hypothetical protein